MKKNKENKENKEKNKKMKTWKKILIVILIIILIAVAWFIYKSQRNGGGVSGMLATVVGHDENTKKDLPEFKALIMGVSTDLDNDLTDTIMIATYNPNTQKANLISVPRDTYTGTNTAKATASKKINALYNITKDPNSTLEAVNELTGLDLEYYAIIKTEALIELVDAIGEVEFNVPIDMDYDDPTQDLHIHLKAGEQKIDGEKAEQLLRFRHSNPDKYGRTTSYPLEYGDNDIGRMRTQREFIAAVLRQTLTPSNIFKIGNILDIASKNIITNINFDYLKDYIPYAVEFNTENLITDSLPGTTPDYKTTNNVSIFVVDKAETKKLMDKLFNTEEEEQEEENTNTVSENTITTNSSNDEIVSQEEKDKIKIEILNGTEQEDIVKEVKQKLEEEGYNVTKTGETNITSNTTIINKKYVDEKILQDIKDVLNTGIISNSMSSTSSVNITIVIGKDYVK